jgi:hypothetical protein
MTGSDHEREEVLVNEDRDSERDDERDDDGAAPSHWWQYRPIIGAAVSGVLLAAGFLGGLTGILPDGWPVLLFIASMPFAGYWWAR